MSNKDNRIKIRPAAIADVETIAIADVETILAFIEKMTSA